MQNIIIARTRLLSEKIALQEDQIAGLTAELAGKDEELAGLRSQLAESQEQNAALQSALQALKLRPVPVSAPAQSQPVPAKTAKPSYLVSLLRQHFSLDSFKAGQEEVIDALLSGRDVFCSMPRHYGMSICFRLPALLMPGLTLIITKSEPEGLPPQPHTEYLTSSMTPAKKRELLRKLKSGTSKLLCSTLELLSSDEIFPSLKAVDISLAIILSGTETLKDCEQFLEMLSKRRISRGVFAQATSPFERQEIFRHLRSPLRVVTGWNKPEVSFRIVRTEDKSRELAEILRQKAGRPGVIYCTSPEAAFKLSETLSASGLLSDAITVLPARLYSEVQRKDVRFIVHYEPPENLASYSQQINPAGLDGQKAECIIILSRQDFREADKSIVRFCEDTASLLTYLGQDDSMIAPAQPEETESFLPEDFSDFDFGTANEAQKEAITCTSGPLLVLAGPGTGKTYTIIQRAVFLIQKKHAAPSSIMLATFTDKAAQELRTRITEALSARNIAADTGAMFIGTFHAICERILKDYADFTEWGKNFRILDDFGHAYIIMQNLKQFEAIDGIDGVFRNAGRWKKAQELMEYINELSEELTDPEELISDPSPAVSALGQAMKLHDQILHAANSMSYSLLLTAAYKLLRDNPEILASMQHKIHYIMIDEYQDTNYVQEQLIFLLGTESRNICVVGDDDQSLYRFRGATVRNILEFPDKWGKNECRTVKLMLNYRSTPAIVRFASEWMEDTGAFFSWENFRNPKHLEASSTAASYPSVVRLAGIHDAEGWHEKILSMLKQLKGAGVIQDYSQTAFLFRSVKAENVQKLSQFLENNNINVYSPRSNLFFQRPEILFALGCLLSMFPEYLRALNAGEFAYMGKEPDYISKYRECIRTVSRHIDKPLYAGLKKHLIKRRKFHADLTGYAGYTYSGLLYELFAFYPFPHALNADISGSVKDLRPARNLARLVQVFRDYEHSYNVNNIKADTMNRQFQMMMNVYIRFRIDEGLDEYESCTEAVPADHVAFMTIHQAKGKEFPVVFVDSLWAKPDADLRRDKNNALLAEIAESHYRRPAFEPADSVKFFDFWRLYYVAFTRAQNLLVLTCNEDGITPSMYLEGAYNRLDDAEEVIDASALPAFPHKETGQHKIYSFTGDILVYEACPMQYKFFNELEFPPDSSQSALLGSLVHATIEDIHKAVLNQEANKITEPGITDWLNENYARLSRQQKTYLPQKSRDAALAQVMRYVHLQGSDWSGIIMSEAEAGVVRGDYILQGRVDLVRLRDDEAEIVDFKTGPKPNININRDRTRLENSRRQVNVYAYMAAKSLGLKVSGMRLYYTGTEGGSPEIAFAYDESTAEEVLRSIDETVKHIAAKDFEHRTSDLETCRDCVFRFFCGRA
ncbi:MAG: UvrD-helicase domain-containing protein [Synergistaceae bacterium]|nr:UvrD-helicase domain-containing protein [Synergistaceae bacterium]